MARTKRNIVEYRIYDLPIQLPILRLAGENWRISDALSPRLHFHNCMEIGFCHTDSGFLSFEDEVVPFQAGDIFLIPRHVPHTTCSAQGCRSLWSYLFLELHSLAKDLALPGSESNMTNRGKYMRISAQEHPRLHFLCRCMLEECADEEEEDQNLLRIYAAGLYSELQRLNRQKNRPSADRGKDFSLKPALEYIHDHYMEPCDTDTLAGLCHLSQTHFRRLFLSCTGETPLQFVISARIRQACVLLRTTDEPVLSIAQAVGITSVSSFNRNFQQVVGMSPRQYRSSAHAPALARQKPQILPYKGWTRAEK